MKKRNKWASFVLGIMLYILVFTSFSITADTFATHYILGTAQFSDGAIAVGARVTITSERGHLETWVGSSGEWKINCGDPGPKWPQGTNFSLKIVGCCGHRGWTGLSTGIVEGSETDMGLILLYPNKAPTTPVITPQQYYVKKNTLATFFILSLDPNEHDVIYRVNWDANGSGDLSDFSLPHPYNEPYVCTHLWSEPGTYAISAVAKDEYGLLSSWSSPIDIIVYESNEPPAVPRIQGPTKGLVHTSYTFEISSYDETDNVQFFIDWDDNTTIGWTEFYGSNETISVSHTWNEVGRYSIMITARDLYGDESSANFSISIGNTLVSIMPIENSMFQISTTIDNHGDFASGQGTYIISIEGKGVLLGSNTFGTLPPLQPGEDVTIQSDFIFGFNPLVHIVITIETPETSIVTYSTQASLYFGFIRIR